VTAAAFYDLEGTLVGTNLVHALLFYAKNQQGLLRSVWKSAATVLSVPAFVAADLYSRRALNDLLFARRTACASSPTSSSRRYCGHHCVQVHAPSSSTRARPGYDR
jgi:hypothetical protein